MNKIIIDKKNLPLDEERKIDIIFNYFSNHQIEMHETETHYHLNLNRSPFLYCERTLDRLDFFNIKQHEVIDFHILGKNSILCLLESWIPFGWSNFFVKQNSLPMNLTIIHLDDHADLMSPNIIIEDNNWIDMYTGKLVNFRNPESIKDAIKSGAITLGSIMTVLVYYIENVNILHLKPNCKTVTQYIERSTQYDSLLAPTKKRLSVNFTNITSQEKHLQSKYFKTSYIDELMQNVPEYSDIFLHIDMDFFNNRYNGSTDYKTNIYHDPDLNQQIEIIDNFCNALSFYQLINRIKHISIGVSPSFYPSEYWEDGLTYLLKKLEDINIKVTTDKNCNKSGMR